MNIQMVEKTKQKLSSRSAITERSAKALANALYKNLQSEGFEAKDIINLSSQLLSLVTSDIKAK